MADSSTTYTTQSMDNWSFDEAFKENTVESMTFNPVTGKLERMTGIQGNASLVVSYNAAGDVIQLDKTINGTIYRKTITRSDMTVAYTLPISSWS